MCCGKIKIKEIVNLAGMRVEWVVILNITARKGLPEKVSFV